MTDSQLKIFMNARINRRNVYNYIKPFPLLKNTTKNDKKNEIHLINNFAFQKVYPF